MFREEVESDLIHAGKFDDRFTSRLLDTNEIEEVTSILSGTIFSGDLTVAYEEYEEVSVLIPLESAADRAFYGQLLDSLVIGEGTGRHREFLEAEIGFRNTHSALRIACSGADLDPADYFIEGGTLFRTTELVLLATSPDRLVLKICNSRYGDHLSVALSDLEVIDSLIDFERALNAALLEYVDALGYMFPFSVTSVVSYTLARECEVDNIRTVAHGHEVGPDPGTIETESVIL